MKARTSKPENYFSNDGKMFNFWKKMKKTASIEPLQKKCIYRLLILFFERVNPKHSCRAGQVSSAYTLWRC